MKDFKFFKTERVFTEYMDRMDDYFLGGIIEPPFGISNRHWNIMPQDLRGGEPRDMFTFIEGFEGGRRGEVVNPYADVHNRDLWNRGYMFHRNRMSSNIYTEMATSIVKYCYENNVSHQGYSHQYTIGSNQETMIINDVQRIAGGVQVHYTIVRSDSSVPYSFIINRTLQNQNWI